MCFDVAKWNMVLHDVTKQFSGIKMFGLPAKKAVIFAIHHECIIYQNFLEINLKNPNCLQTDK